MLYAKINPAATYTVQVSPFSATTTQCSYMTAYARPYAVGAEQMPAPVGIFASLMNFFKDKASALVLNASKDIRAAQSPTNATRERSKTPRASLTA
jgi:hypothetical protein